MFIELDMAMKMLQILILIPDKKNIFNIGLLHPKGFEWLCNIVSNKWQFFNQL